eukprot:461-Eustigmatos_ZCMA.PRE.1
MPDADPEQAEPGDERRAYWRGDEVAEALPELTADQADGLPGQPGRDHSILPAFAAGMPSLHSAISSMRRLSRP